MKRKAEQHPDEPTPKDIKVDELPCLDYESDEEDELVVADLEKVFAFATNKKTEACVCMYLKEIGNSSYCRDLDITQFEEEMLKRVEET